MWLWCGHIYPGGSLFSLIVPYLPPLTKVPRVASNCSVPFASPCLYLPQLEPNGKPPWYYSDSVPRCRQHYIKRVNELTHYVAPTCTVYPKKYAHGFCFAVLCCGYTLTDFPISIRLTSLALWQSNDCPSASKETLMNMNKYFKWIHYERLHNHSKAKHNKTVCIYCKEPPWPFWKTTKNTNQMWEIYIAGASDFIDHYTVQ